MLTKVPEESQLIYRAPAASLECSCFINDSEFLSGSDDGSLELWSITRKKPTHIVKNAHPIASSTTNPNVPVENGTKEVTEGNIQQFCWQTVYIIFALDLRILFLKLTIFTSLIFFYNPLKFLLLLVYSKELANLV